MHDDSALTQPGVIFIYLCVFVCCILTLTFLACVSSIARQAKAEEGINLVDASASIFTWL